MNFETIGDWDPSFSGEFPTWPLIDDTIPMSDWCKGPDGKRDTLATLVKLVADEMDKNIPFPHQKRIIFTDVKVNDEIGIESRAVVCCAYNFENVRISPIITAGYVV